MCYCSVGSRSALRRMKMLKCLFFMGAETTTEAIVNAECSFLACRSDVIWMSIKYQLQGRSRLPSSGLLSLTLCSTRSIKAA